MHHHLEIIMPSTADVTAAVTQIMAPFDENVSDEDHDSRYAFWDFWMIGGRWTGAKAQASIKPEALKAFRVKLEEMKVTVSGLQMGKPTLYPISQQSVVDALWRSEFPNSPAKQCPLFDHYKASEGDIARLGDAPLGMRCDRVIIARLNDRKGELEPVYMMAKRSWNGVNFQNSAWGGTIESALSDYDVYLKGYLSEYATKNRPTMDWLCVTVDYHS